MTRERPESIDLDSRPIAAAPVAPVDRVRTGGGPSSRQPHEIVDGPTYAPTPSSADASFEAPKPSGRIVCEGLVSRRHDCGRRGLVRDLRHLAEREVLVEPFGRQAVDGARQQRDEGAACGIGPAGAAIEVHGHTTARARVLQQTEVLLRRAEEHRHLVERHAAAGLVENPAHDLDGFASFARRREHHDVAGALTYSRPLGLEDVLTQTVQI